MEITETDPSITSLLDKLDAIELTGDERACLADLLGVEPEVEGFEKRTYAGNSPVVQGLKLGLPKAWGGDPDSLIPVMY